MQKPTWKATTRFLSVNGVFTRAALIVLLSFTSLCTVRKEFVPLGYEKHYPPRFGVGHSGGYGSGFCLPAFGISLIVCRHGAKISLQPNGKTIAWTCSSIANIRNNSEILRAAVVCDGFGCSESIGRRGLVKDPS